MATVGARFDGRVLVVAVLALYLGSVAIGGRAQWDRLRVPAETPSFLDMRSITTAWECERRGIDPLPRNPCDPRERPANYPRLWLLPGRLGLGEGATVPFAVLSAFAFFAAVLWFVGRLKLWEGVVLAIALCSPAVMLGVERGNVDLLVLALVIVALMLFRRRSTPLRVVSHGLVLLAAILKIFPVFAFVVLVGQRRSWLIVAAAVGALFALDVALTFGDLETIRKVVPQEISLSYGAGALADAVAHSLDVHTGWPTQGHEHQVGRWFSAGVVVAGAAGAAILALRRRGLVDWRIRTVRSDAFLAGAAIYVGTYVLLHNYDYRLACLVLTLPQLWLWAGLFGRVALGSVLLALLTAARTSYGFPYEEVVNWLVFVVLSSALVNAAAATWADYCSRPKIELSST